MTSRKTLVAGVGNIFQRDDAFGGEVIRLLQGRAAPPGVKIADFGIGGVHLVYELLDGCDLFVLVDAARRGCQPGTITVLEVEPEDMAAHSGVMDAHGLAPDQVFALLDSMGGRPGRSLVVACEPADVSPGMGLSDQVREALPAAVRAVEAIIQTQEADNDDHADQGGRRRGNRGDSDLGAAGCQALHKDEPDVRPGRGRPSPASPSGAGE